VFGNDDTTLEAKALAQCPLPQANGVRVD
jgi:hypothetical protein